MYITQISGHHIDITPAIKDHINEKLIKIAKLTDQITSINVTLFKDNNYQKAEARIYLPGKEIFVMASSKNRLFYAIDAMINKLTRQIRKHKTKLAISNSKKAIKN